MDQAHSEASPSIPTPPRRRRSLPVRLLRIGGLLGVLLLALVLVAPALVSTGFVRGKITASLSESLGVPVEIDEIGLGWFSGARLRGLRVEQPEGFEGEHGRLLELADFEGGVSLRSLLVDQRIDVSGVVERLRLVVVQDESGATNLEQLGTVGGAVVVVDDGGSSDPDPGAPGDDDQEDVLARLRLALEVRHTEVLMVRQSQGVLEHLDNVHVEVTKPYGVAEIHCVFDADLRGAGDDAGEPGKLALRANIDPAPGAPLDLLLTCSALHLERYRPLIDSFVEPGAIAALSGTLDANVTVGGVPDEALTVRGRMTIAKPHFAGPLFQGMNIHAEEWTLQPDVGLTFPMGEGAMAAGEGAGALPQMDLSGVRADFGFASIEGLANDDQQRPGLRFDIDVDALAGFGGPLPELLRKTGLRTSGELRAPLRADLAELPLSELLGIVGVDVRVEMHELEVGGQRLSGLGAQLSLAGGKAALSTTGGAFDGGALQLKIESDDITRLAAADVRLEVGVSGAQVGAEAIEGLQYAFPVLAGLQQVPVSERVFASKLDFTMRLAGPVAPAADQELLGWLNHWSGAGDARLFDGQLAPAGGLQELLQLTGGAAQAAAGPGGGRKALLAFKDLTTDFTLREGAVSTGLMKLEAKGREIGIRGQTRLSGAIDYLLDARSLLAEHKDGAKILELLGEDFELGARLSGSLEAPRLALPDIAQVVRENLPKLLEQQGAEALQKLLRGGKDPEPGEQATEDPVQKAAQDLLKGILGGTPKKQGEPEKKDGQQPPKKDPEEEARKAIENLLRGVLGGGK